jgi:electron transfer flavoprotein beta subunit
MAEHLGIPAFTSVQDINIYNGRAQITRDIGSYYEVYETELPIVACVLKGINNPRVCTERNIDVEVMDANGLESNRIGLDGSPTRVVSISIHEREKSYVDVDSSLSCEKRIECIINGGIKRKKTKLIRGNVKKLSKTLLDDDVFRVLANLEKKVEA